MPASLNKHILPGKLDMQAEPIPTTLRISKAGVHFSVSTPEH